MAGAPFGREVAGEARQCLCFYLFCGLQGRISINSRRVEDRLSPAFPHQTVHALLTHTAFRCPSRQGMRICPSNVDQRN